MVKRPNLGRVLAPAKVTNDFVAGRESVHKADFVIKAGEQDDALVVFGEYLASLLAVC